MYGGNASRQLASFFQAFPVCLKTLTVFTTPKSSHCVQEASQSNQILKRLRFLEVPHHLSKCVWSTIPLLQEPPSA